VGVGGSLFRECRAPTGLIGPEAAEPGFGVPTVGHCLTLAATADCEDLPRKDSQMIGYVTLGTNDMQRAAAFYDALLGVLGARRIMEFDTFIAWAVSPTQPAVSVIKPYDGNPATVGNGVMVALAVDSKDKVDLLYRKAIELGAKDEGPAGPRGENFYAGYFRDPDGNKLNVFCMTAP
jgi:predicted lactoylglutathione lyase